MNAILLLSLLLGHPAVGQEVAFARPSVGGEPVAVFGNEPPGAVLWGHERGVFFAQRLAAGRPSVEVYLQRRLILWDLDRPSEVADGRRWFVSEGDGHPVSTWRLALLTSDDQALDRLIREREHLPLRTVILGAASGTCLLSSALILVHARDGLPAWSDWSPSIWHSGSLSEWASAREQAREAWRKAVGQVPISDRRRAEDQTWIGVALAGTGVLVAASLPFALWERRSHEQPGGVYTREQAERVLSEYDARLRDALGLQVVESKEAPSSPAATRPPAGAQLEGNAPSVHVAVGPGSVVLGLEF